MPLRSLRTRTAAGALAGLLALAVGASLLVTQEAGAEGPEPSEQEIEAISRLAAAADLRDGLPLQQLAAALWALRLARPGETERRARLGLRIDELAGRVVTETGSPLGLIDALDDALLDVYGRLRRVLELAPLITTGPGRELAAEKERELNAHADLLRELAGIVQAAPSADAFTAAVQARMQAARDAGEAAAAPRPAVLPGFETFDDDLGGDVLEADDDGYRDPIQVRFEMRSAASPSPGETTVAVQLGIALARAAAIRDGLPGAAASRADVAALTGALDTEAAGHDDPARHLRAELRRAIADAADRRQRIRDAYQATRPFGGPAPDEDGLGETQAGLLAEVSAQAELLVLLLYDLEAAGVTTSADAAGRVLRLVQAPVAEPLPGLGATVSGRPDPPEVRLGEAVARVADLVPSRNPAVARDAMDAVVRELNRAARRAASTGDAPSAEDFIRERLGYAARILAFREGRARLEEGLARDDVQLADRAEIAIAARRVMDELVASLRVAPGLPLDVAVAQLVADVEPFLHTPAEHLAEALHVYRIEPHHPAGYLQRLVDTITAPALVRDLPVERQLALAVERITGELRRAVAERDEQPPGDDRDDTDRLIAVRRDHLRLLEAVLALVRDGVEPREAVDRTIADPDVLPDAGAVGDARGPREIRLDLTQRIAAASPGMRLTERLAALDLPRDLLTEVGIAQVVALIREDVAILGDGAGLASVPAELDAVAGLLRELAALGVAERADRDRLAQIRKAREVAGRLVPAAGRAERLAAAVHELLPEDVRTVEDLLDRLQAPGATTGSVLRGLLAGDPLDPEEAGLRRQVLTGYLRGIVDAPDPGRSAEGADRWFELLRALELLESPPDQHALDVYSSRLGRVLTGDVFGGALMAEIELRAIREYLTAAAALAEAEGRTDDPGAWLAGVVERGLDSIEGDGEQDEAARQALRRVGAAVGRGRPLGQAIDQVSAGPPEPEARDAPVGAELVAVEQAPVPAPAVVPDPRRSDPAWGRAPSATALRAAVIARDRAGDQLREEIELRPWPETPVPVGPPAQTPAQVAFDAAAAEAARLDTVDLERYQAWNDIGRPPVGDAGTTASPVPPVDPTAQLRPGLGAGTEGNRAEGTTAEGTGEGGDPAGEGIAKLMVTAPSGLGIALPGQTRSGPGPDEGVAGLLKGR